MALSLPPIGKQLSRVTSEWTFKGDISCHQVWVWLAVASRFTIAMWLPSRDITSGNVHLVCMLTGSVYLFRFSLLSRLLDWSSNQWLAMVNHTHTWWHNMSPLSRFFLLQSDMRSIQIRAWLLAQGCPQVMMWTLGIEPRNFMAGGRANAWSLEQPHHNTKLPCPRV